MKNGKNTANLIVLCYDNFGENKVSLQRNGMAAIPKNRGQLKQSFAKIFVTGPKKAGAKRTLSNIFATNSGRYLEWQSLLDFICRLAFYSIKNIGRIGGQSRLKLELNRPIVISYKLTTHMSVTYKRINTIPVNTTYNNSSLSVLCNNSTLIL